MLLIDKNCNRSLKNIVLHLNPRMNNNKKILKCIDNLITANNNNYKYGSSWIDYCTRNYTIKKLNCLLRNDNCIMFIYSYIK